MNRKEFINMARRGGFPGGGMPGNMNNLMKQAQRMQKQMEEKTKELERRHGKLVPRRCCNSDRDRKERSWLRKNITRSC